MIQWGKTSCRAPAIDLHLGCVYCKRAAAWCYSALPLCYNNVSFRWVCVICTNLCVQLSKKALKEDIDFISTGKHCPLLTWQWHRGWWVLRKQLKQGKSMFQNSIKNSLCAVFNALRFGVAFQNTWPFIYLQLRETADIADAATICRTLLMYYALNKSHGITFMYQACAKWRGALTVCLPCAWKHSYILPLSMHLLSQESQSCTSYKLRNMGQGQWGERMRRQKSRWGERREQRGKGIDLEARWPQFPPAVRQYLDLGRIMSWKQRKSYHFSVQ